MAERIIDLSYLVCIIEKFNSGGLTLKCQMIFLHGSDATISGNLLAHIAGNFLRGLGRIFVIG